MTRVAEVMTRGARAMLPQDSLQEAARAMDDLNVGVLPVCENDRVIGMVTDRDIVVRAVSANLPADSTPLSDVMTAEPSCCQEDDMLEDVMRTMEERQIRRLPVLDREGRLVGIVSLGDVAAKSTIEDAGMVLAEVSQPAKPDRSRGQDAVGSAGRADGRQSPMQA